MKNISKALAVFLLLMAIEGCSIKGGRLIEGGPAYFTFANANKNKEVQAGTILVKHLSLKDTTKITKYDTISSASSFIAENRDYGIVFTLGRGGVFLATDNNKLLLEYSDKTTDFVELSGVLRSTFTPHFLPPTIMVNGKAIMAQEYKYDSFEGYGSFDRSYIYVLR